MKNEQSGSDDDRRGPDRDRRPPLAEFAQDERQRLRTVGEPRIGHRADRDGLDLGAG